MPRPGRDSPQERGALHAHGEGQSTCGGRRVSDLLVVFETITFVLVQSRESPLGDRVWVSGQTPEFGPTVH